MTLNADHRLTVGGHDPRPAHVLIKVFGNLMLANQCVRWILENRSVYRALCARDLSCFLLLRSVSTFLLDISMHGNWCQESHGMMI